MNDTPKYPEYLISAVNSETAEQFARENGFDNVDWFRLPSTLDDETEAFKKETTPPWDKEKVSNLTSAELDEMSLKNHRNCRIIFAKDFATASKYAAKRNWWLHAWKFVSDPELENEVVEYGFYC